MRSHDAEPRAPRRDEAADLREQGDQRHLAEVGGLARHVRPGEDHDAVGDIQARVVGHEGPASEAQLDQGVAPGLDVGDRRAVDDGPHPALVVGDGGQRLGHIGGGAGSGATEQRGAVGGDPAHRLGQQLQLAGQGALAGAQHDALLLLEPRGDVALGADQRLLAQVVGWHRLPVGVGDLEVVAEDPVVTDLERADAGALPLLPLQPGDEVAGLGGGAVQPVQLGVGPVADEATLPRGRGRVVDERRPQVTLDLPGWHGRRRQARPARRAGPRGGGRRPAAPRMPHGWRPGRAVWPGPGPRVPPASPGRGRSRAGGAAPRVAGGRRPGPPPPRGARRWARAR